jgi:hypothetical protein
MTSLRLRRFVFGTSGFLAALLLAPLGLALLALAAAALWGPPFGAILYLLVPVAVLTTVPGLVALYLFLRRRVPYAPTSRNVGPSGVRS